MMAATGVILKVVGNRMAMAAEGPIPVPFPNWMLLWAILICYMIGGCVMDALAFLLISLPIFYPIVEKMGYDPVWYGQVITITTTMGASNQFSDLSRRQLKKFVQFVLGDVSHFMCPIQTWVAIHRE